MSAVCFFLDVGQGTSNVVLLGGRRAIVIDCGPGGTMVPLEILRDHGVSRIEALVLSHNDRDHWAGAARLIPAYSTQIERVYFLQDRPAEDIGVFKLLQMEHAAGRLKRKPLWLGTW